MSTIHYGDKTPVLVTVKGHPYERNAFAGLLESLEGYHCTTVEQPACQALFSPEYINDYKAVIAYDMPGINFDTQPPTLVPPPDSFKQDFINMLDEGKGVVFLHHSIAAWPLWPEYADIVGGRFWYLPQTHRGIDYPDGGYLHAAQHQVQTLATHPVTAGVEKEFTLTDELYLYDVFDSQIEPLLSSNFDFNAEQFYSATEAVSGRMYSRDNWARRTGSNLLGWVKHYRNSPIVYLQMGDGPSAYQNPQVQKLLSNAVQWVCSDEAGQWARARYQAEQ